MFNLPAILGWFLLMPALLTIATHCALQGQKKGLLEGGEPRRKPAFPHWLAVAVVGLGTSTGNLLTYGFLNLLWAPALLVFVLAYGLHVFMRGRPLRIPALPVARARGGDVWI